MKVNYLGCVYPTKFALPHILKSRGTIAVISSISAITGAPFRTGYAASKKALHGFFDSLRVEISPKSGVKICVLCPGYIQNDFRKRAYMNPKAEVEPDLHVDRMELDECAKISIQAIAKGKRYEYYTSLQKIAPLLKALFPNIVDSIVRKKANYSPKY
eukprot:TRINITY_DN5124_c0_g2_i2.p1 TRINITY_DN5124_c0_g2~~TRINITY_DN5124_c0_g2_i2.p1  ORF type:complete len:158 (+),score=21.39 TRINITY_DN5124_c0_g2_i2:405-878(+)